MRRNSYSIPTSCNAAMRRQNRAICPVAESPNRLTDQSAESQKNHGVMGDGKRSTEVSRVKHFGAISIAGNHIRVVDTLQNFPRVYPLHKRQWDPAASAVARVRYPAVARRPAWHPPPTHLIRHSRRPSARRRPHARWWRSASKTGKRASWLARSAPGIDVARPLDTFSRIADQKLVARINHHRVLVGGIFRLLKHTRQGFWVRAVGETTRV